MLDERFPHHVEGCICQRFVDIAPSLIADVTCPIHGINGTSPGDLIEGYGGAYERDDPKHPDFHDTHADIWDSREGK